MAIIEKQLEEIGLNEKEVKVYLASLELGQTTVQNIAKKSAVNRATAYFVIDGLMKRGLMSSFHKGKKQFFIAADPDRLIDLLEKEKEDLERKKSELKKLLPQLQSMNNKQSDRPVVKYYEGKEGIKTMLEEFLSSKKGIAHMAYSYDAISNIFSEEEKLKARKQRLGRKIKTKAIYTYKNGALSQIPESERRRVPEDKFPINSDIAVYDNKVRIASLGNRLIGVIIEDKEIAKSMEAILELAWEGAEKYQKIK